MTASLEVEVGGAWFPTTPEKEALRDKSKRDGLRYRCRGPEGGFSKALTIHEVQRRYGGGRSPFGFNCSDFTYDFTDLWNRMNQQAAAHQPRPKSRRKG